MHAFTIPVAPLVGPPAPSAAEMADRRAPVPEVQRDIDARQLAQAEPIKPPADPTPPANAAAGGKSEASSRFVYDLEKGNPMPSDGRDEKPVY